VPRSYVSTYKYSVLQRFADTCAYSQRAPAGRLFACATRRRNMVRSSALPFADRYEAGRRLGRVLAQLSLRRPLRVLGLPRGGVPVASEVARALHAPLDVMLVRKVGMPGQPELALGAIAAGGITVEQPDGDFAPSVREFAALAQRERIELQRREHLYRSGLAPLNLIGETAVLVDDGLATGATMLAAIRAARLAGAAAVVAAVPVSSREAAERIRGECDEVTILQIPPSLNAVGEWYEDFTQVEDADVCRLLQRARETRGAGLNP
jgi:putative phosphoribosyl transferase